MDNPTHFSNVQYVNFNLLMAIHTNIQRDPIAAAYQFHLSRTQIEKLSRLSLEDMEALAASMHSECLFIPRANLDQLLGAPPGLAIALAATTARIDGKNNVMAVERRISRAA